MSEAPPPVPFSPDLQASTQTAGQTIDENQGRIFPCESCGADLKFNIGQQQLKCPYCGYEKELHTEGGEVVEQDYHAALERLRELHDKEPSSEQLEHEIRCNACGGTLVFAGSLTSSECPYCLSPIQRENVHDAEHRISVDGVLPFLVEKETAATNLKAWVKSRWFAPNDFLQRGAKGKFSGVYLPYWTFDSLTYNQYRGQRGEYYYVTVGSGKNKRRERRTRWYPASGDFQQFFDDVLVLASRGLPRELMLQLEPWPLGKCLPFTQEVLAGYLARTYEIELDDGFQDARVRIDAAIATSVRQRIGGDTQRVDSINTSYDALTFKHLLLPVWLLAYRYREHLYQVAINAATGEVQGERPYSWIKICLAVLAGVAVVGIVGFLSTQR